MRRHLAFRDGRCAARGRPGMWCDRVARTFQRSHREPTSCRSVGSSGAHPSRRHGRSPAPSRGSPGTRRDALTTNDPPARIVGVPTRDLLGSAVSHVGRGRFPRVRHDSAGPSGNIHSAEPLVLGVLGRRGGARGALLTELANRAEDYEQITDGIRLRFSATSRRCRPSRERWRRNGTVADFSGF